MSIQLDQLMRPKRLYGTTTTVLVGDELSGGGATAFQGPAAVRTKPPRSDRRDRSEKDSSSQLIRRFILTTGLVMPYEPADEAFPPPDTITSVMPRSLQQDEL